MAISTQRSGRYVQQSTGYRAFIPAPLPPNPEIEFDGELRTLLSQVLHPTAKSNRPTTWGFMTRASNYQNCNSIG